ncbi:MAG: aldo/keto reductase [Succinivibrio sp.]|nr:aldo/keto reductase [Succinivibrio sp.]
MENQEFTSPSSTLSLVNGKAIPVLGFGTWQTPDGDTAISAVLQAFKCGYRHIDTAAIYGNESSIGVALQRGMNELGLKREELFVTSKLWNAMRGYEKTKQAFFKTLQDLKLDYLDLYLIHWPANSRQYPNFAEINLSTWKAFEELYKDGYIKAIGVSNFLEKHLSALVESEIPPMVNQIEFHPGFRQEQVCSYCRKHQILIEAWGPLGTGRMLDNPNLKAIAANYQKSVAQLCIRWCLQNGTVPLPKSVNAERIRANTEIFDFTISAQDMQTINEMAYCGGSGHDPDQVGF